ncbi:MAG: NUDIX hydrolase [Chloroflexi bacterium]|nr:NUDIX hydrolase [Chloroflexota bacterium]
MTTGINFCVRCGQPLQDRAMFGKIRRTCPGCGYIHFQDPKVAAIAFIVDANRVLLVKRAENPEKGKWSLPGGFVDAGEDPRQAAIREAFEETGLQVEITHLLEVFFHPASNGNPIVIAFSAQIIGGALCAADDAEEVAWFTAETLPELAFDSTHALINHWRTSQSSE